MFRFKQFQIRQLHAAMKVCTDSCLFGAWIDAAEHFEQVLDVGTGTGLLTLMMAQKSVTSAQFTAVEIDDGACLDAKHNFESSPWHSSIRLIHADFIRYAGETEQQFDKIIVNPPFFSNSLKGKNELKNRAIHIYQLKTQNMLPAFNRLLTSSGVLYVMYPPHEAHVFEDHANGFNFYCTQECQVSNTPNTQPIRIMKAFRRNPMPKTISRISIRTSDGKQYSKEFISLLKPYYLSL